MYVMNKDAILQHPGKDTERRILAYDKPLMLAEMTMQKGALGAMHTHPHAQIDYVVAGSVEFNMGGDVRVMRAGDSVYIPSETPHGAVALEDDTILLDIFSPMRDEFVEK